MEQLMEVLFESPVGLSSLAVILTTAIIVGYVFFMLYKKSKKSRS